MIVKVIIDGSQDGINCICIYKLKSQIVIYKYVYLIFCKAFKVTVYINHLSIFCMEDLGLGSQIKPHVYNTGNDFRFII